MTRRQSFTMLRPGDACPVLIVAHRVDGYDEELGAFVGAIDAVRVDDLDEMPEVSEPNRDD